MKEKGGENLVTQSFQIKTTKRNLLETTFFPNLTWFPTCLQPESAKIKICLSIK